MKEQRRKAYDAGWRASGRGHTDLDRSEARFCSRNPDPNNMFSAGWVDFAVGERIKYHTLINEHPEDFE